MASIHLACTCAEIGSSSPESSKRKALDVRARRSVVCAKRGMSVSESRYDCSMWWERIVKRISAGSVGRVGSEVVVRVLISGIIV